MTENLNERSLNGTVKYVMRAYGWSVRMPRCYDDNFKNEHEFSTGDVDLHQKYRYVIKAGSARQKGIEPRVTYRGVCS